MPSPLDTAADKSISALLAERGFTHRKPADANRTQYFHDVIHVGTGLVVGLFEAGYAHALIVEGTMPIGEAA